MRQCQMATANYINDKKSMDLGSRRYEFYINQVPLEFYPSGAKAHTKIGLLWRICSQDTFYLYNGKIPRGLESSCQFFVCLDVSEAVAACLPSVDMKLLTAAQKDLLLPVPYTERLYCLEKNLQMGLTCHVGDCVLVADPSRLKIREPTKFVVRFKGSLRERNDRGCAGTYFGLVSSEPVKGHEPKEVSCFRHTYSPDVLQYAVRERSEADHQVVLCHLEWIVGLVDKKFSLKSGDEVVWFDDERPSPLRGVVAGIVSDKLASVNFELDGKKKVIDVPIEALMLASEYAPESSERPSTKLDAQYCLGSSASASALSNINQHENSITLAAEHGLVVNGPILISEPRNRPPVKGFLLWCGRFGGKLITCVDCETQPFDTVSTAAVRAACPDAPTDPRNAAFVYMDRVRLDQRLPRPAPILGADQHGQYVEELCELSETVQASALPVNVVTAEQGSKLDSNFTKWNIMLKKNGKKKCIGEGGFGKVYKAYTDLHQIVAVKIVKLRGVRDVNQLEKAIELARQGIELLKTVRHPNIMIFLKSELKADNQFCIFTELIAGSSLANLMLEQRKPFDEAGVRKFAFQICSALNFLHLHKPTILHRDINCNNIMLTNEGIIKLINFGLAKELISATVYNTAHTCGTPYFMAPELFNPDGNPVYSAKSDVWALGCTVFEMVESQPPNSHLRREQIPMAVLNRDMPQMTGSVSESLKHFYSRCVVKDRKQRPDTSELMQHEFFMAEH